MPELTEAEIADHAVEIANAIEGVIEGRPTVAIYVALGMVIGAGATEGERPDLAGLMLRITRVAINEFESRMRAQGRC